MVPKFRICILVPGGQTNAGTLAAASWYIGKAIAMKFLGKLSSSVKLCGQRFNVAFGVAGFLQYYRKTKSLNTSGQAAIYMHLLTNIGKLDR